MNTHKKSQVEIKTIALNTINEHAAKFYEYEKNHFAQFIGKDIFKANGEVKAKFEHEKIKFSGQLDDGTFYDSHYWFENRYGHFGMVVKTCVNGGSWDTVPTTAFCTYEQISVDLFDIENGLLIETKRPQRDFSYRYNVAEILKKVDEAKVAAEEYGKVLQAVPYEFREMFHLNRI